MNLERLARATLGVLSVAALAVSCQGLPAGPSLSQVRLSDISLQPTFPDTPLCCCRVVGKVTNLNSVPVHLTIKFYAFDVDAPNPQKDDAISAIIYQVKDLEPQAVHSIDAHGFLFACSVVKQLKVEVDVKGIAFGPF